MWTFVLVIYWLALYCEYLKDMNKNISVSFMDYEKLELVLNVSSYFFLQ